MSKDKKTFLISVAKYFHKNATHEELRKTKLTVTCKDWSDAVIAHNKVFKNYYEVCRLNLLNPRRI